MLPRACVCQRAQAEKRSIEAPKAFEQHQPSRRSLGREEQRRSRQAWQETAHVCKRESQNSEGTKSKVGEGESGEEESLTPPFVALKLKLEGDLSGFGLCPARPSLVYGLA